MTVINYILESILVLGVFLGYYHFFLANQTCHSFKRYYLLATVLLGVLAPMIHLPISQDSAMATITLPELSNGQLSPAELYSPTINYFTLIYLVIAVALMIRFSFQLYKIVVSIRRHKTTNLNEFLLVHDQELASRSSFFKYIFWDSNSLPENDNDNLIMRHEIAHAKGWHSLDILFFEITRILLWFNPIIYLYQKEAVINLEYLADRESAPQDHTTYNSLLASSAIESFGFSMGNHFNKSFTLKRIIEVGT